MRSLRRFRPLMTILTKSAASAAACAASCAVYAGELTVTVENIQTDEGRLMFSVGDEAAFKGEGEHAIQVTMAASVGSVSFTTDALPDGTYAVQVMHDVNNNGELDANLVGMPKEPWGFSNNARGNFGPPKFADTQFELTGETSVTVKIER